MNKIASIILRYLAIVLVSFNSLWIFYALFTPLTLYLSCAILSIFYSVSIEHSAIMINGNVINIIDACAAGSAYFLLFILNFSTPKIKKRLAVLIANFLIFLAVNVLRIVLLSSLFLSDFKYFTEAHAIGWHMISALFVVIIWIATVNIAKIKEIPIYSDFIHLKKIIEKK